MFFADSGKLLQNVHDRFAEPVHARFAYPYEGSLARKPDRLHELAPLLPIRAKPHRRLREKLRRVDDLPNGVRVSLRGAKKADTLGRHVSAGNTLVSTRRRSGRRSRLCIAQSEISSKNWACAGRIQLALETRTSLAIHPGLWMYVPVSDRSARGPRQRRWTGMFGPEAALVMPPTQA